MNEDLPKEFLLFEAGMLERRYDYLKNRDKENFLKHVKLFSFLILYGIGPFLSETSLSPQLLPLWGLGGIWLVITILFYFDRDFRAYGLHLKERVLCLYQLAGIREVALGTLSEYVKRSVLPLGQLNRSSSQQHESFPERLSAGQIRAACYIFKFLGLFPLLYMTIFCQALVEPEAMTLNNASVPLAVLFILSPLFSLWLYLSVMRCLDLQRTAFEARRICSDNPWPSFDRESLKTIAQSTNSGSLNRLLIGLMFSLSLICTGVFAYHKVPWLSVSYQVLVPIMSALTIVWVVYFFQSDTYMTGVLEEMKKVYKRDRCIEVVTSNREGEKL